jgi:hypothetical protein
LYGRLGIYRAKDVREEFGSIPQLIKCSVGETFSLPVGLSRVNATRWPGSATGNVWNITASIKLKIAVFAPIPSASEKQGNCRKTW